MLLRSPSCNNPARYTPHQARWRGRLVLETSWGKALRLADAALLWPLAQADDALQHRFEQVWREVFNDGPPAVQATVTGMVQDFHWRKDDARRRLDDELVWTPPRHGAVLAASVNRLDSMDGERQTRLVRRLLGRSPLGGGNDLANALGFWLGQDAMDFRPRSGRRAIVPLVNEIAAAPQSWALLDAPEHRRTFFYQLMRGMQYMAGQLWPRARQLAADYGRWNRIFWRELRAAGGGSDEETRMAVTLPLSWMPETGPTVQANPPPTPRDPAIMKLWWRALQPLCLDIVGEGSEEDVYHLLYNQGPGQMNHVMQASEVCGWMETLLERLETGLRSQTLSLDLPADSSRHFCWRENLRHAVNALDSLRADDLLDTEQDREAAVRLLDRMASPPFGLDLAKHKLPRYRSEQA